MPGLPRSGYLFVNEQSLLGRGRPAHVSQAELAGASFPQQGKSVLGLPGWAALGLNHLLMARLGTYFFC